jgi:formylglycine-generating enzyme required for sulfatase activity/serine/threonine protein kinase
MFNSPRTANPAPSGRAYEILADHAEFGGYVIVRCLAYDMLGSLYLVQNSQSGLRETLFVFSSMVAEDKEFHDRFTTQTKKLCALHHPNLLNFTQALVIQNSYCLVGEAFEGLSLPDHLMLLTGSQLSTAETTQAINLPPAQVTPILEQALTALAYAHEHKILHLNLNPTKILRSTFGEVKVYGFHFLAILGQELFEVLVSAGIPPLKLDPNRSYLGTTDILSPEARMRQPLEYRSDLYAIGVDTHWLLTGRKPTSPYQPPSKLSPQTDAGWDAFIIHSLQRKLDDRYPSATAMLADLRNLAHLAPIAQGGPLELLLPPETAADPKAKKKEPQKTPLKKAKPVKPPRRARKPFTPLQRLLFIGLPSLLAVAAGAYLYVLLMTGDVDESGAHVVASRSKAGQTPRLRLTITPRNAMVTVDPGKNIFEVSDGELPLNIIPGQYNVEIESPQHRTQRIPYTVTTEPDHLFINLDPAWAQVDFATVPGATIRAIPEHGEPVYLGVAPDDGVLHAAQGLVEGTFTFEASKDNYQSAVLKGQKLEFAKSYHVTLKPVAEPATITLLSDPPGVSVYLGDRVLGQTPLTTRDLPVDTDVALTLQQQGYRPVARTIRVQPNETEEINLGNLSAKTGLLTLGFTFNGRAPTPEELRDAEITINDRAYPSNLRRLPNILEGGYHIVIQHPDYFPADKTVAVTDGQTTDVTVDLAPRPGRLIIQPSPASPITVTLDGQPLAASADGSYPLPPGQTAKVLVAAQNFAGAEHEFKLGPNEVETWDVPLQVIPGPKSGENYSTPYLDLALSWIPSGTFNMGSPGTESERKATEGPMTTVVIPFGFWAGSYAVTQAQYRAIMGDNPSEFGHASADAGRYPVEHVSWQQAVDFTRALNEREQAAGRVPAGYEYRLPTEAEWEYFARAGTTTPFNFGEHADQSNGNFRGAYPRASGSDVTSLNSSTGTKPVGSYAPNAWGLYDIHGNVSEWVLDVYKSRLPGGTITDPAPATGDPDARRAFRGGAWSDYAADSRSAWRDDGARPDTASSAIGFRVVLAPKIPDANH